MAISPRSQRKRAKRIIKKPEVPARPPLQCAWFPPPNQPLNETADSPYTYDSDESDYLDIRFYFTGEGEGKLLSELLKD